jgi:hypothetical protein
MGARTATCATTLFRHAPSGVTSVSPGSHRRGAPSLMQSTVSCSDVPSRALPVAWPEAGGGVGYRTANAEFQKSSASPRNQLSRTALFRQAQQQGFTSRQKVFAEDSVLALMCALMAESQGFTSRQKVQRVRSLDPCAQSVQRAIGPHSAARPGPAAYALNCSPGQGSIGPHKAARPGSVTLMDLTNALHHGFAGGFILIVRRVQPGLENSRAHRARTRDHLLRRLGGVLEVGSPGGAQRHPQRGQDPARSCRRVHLDG